MATGDFPNPPGMVWTDAFGWVPREAMAQPVIPRGCICPPTSEKTCQAPMCPRQKPFK